MDTVTATIASHYRRQATPEVWQEVESLRYRVANLEGSLRHVRDRVYSLMRCQEQDCEVNGPNHPGLLTPMRDLLRGLHAELQLLTNATPPNPNQEDSPNVGR